MKIDPVAYLMRAREVRIITLGNDRDPKRPTNDDDGASD